MSLASRTQAGSTCQRPAALRYRAVSGRNTWARRWEPSADSVTRSQWSLNQSAEVSVASGVVTPLTTRSSWSSNPRLTATA